MTGFFRELTADEVAMVAGGYDFYGETVYRGRTFRYGDGYIMPREWLESDPLDSDPARSDDSDAGHNIPSFADWAANTCDADFSTDWVARQIEAEIKAKPDWNEREYGAIIYMTPEGLLMAGPLTAGMTVAEAISAGLPAPETRISLPPGFVEAGHKIVAVVHSHPDVGYNNQEDLDNQYPSSYLNNDGTAGGDYATFNDLISMTDNGTDLRFVNGAVFAQYILGPDGILREFNFKDGQVSYNTDTQQERDSRSNLAADRPCAA